MGIYEQSILLIYNDNELHLLECSSLFTLEHSAKKLLIVTSIILQTKIGSLNLTLFWGHNFLMERLETYTWFKVAYDQAVCHDHEPRLFVQGHGH